MSLAASPEDGRRRSGRWWVAAVVLLFIAAACLVPGLPGSQHPLAGPAAPRSSAAGSTPRAAPTRAAPVVARSTPVWLSIPAIGVAVPVSELGLNADGTVQVPTDFQEPGWYRLGPSPGQVGSAVILGHVDSYQGPAIFFQLRSLQAGDQVEVSLADGVVTDFVVTAVAMYPKAQFPALEVYGPHGYSGLQLVTCGGAFDSQTGHYLSNVVVYTSLVSTTPPASSIAMAA